MGRHTMIVSKTHVQMNLDDIQRSLNSADAMLEQSAESLTNADAASTAIMAVAYMLQAINGQLSRIADILEDRNGEVSQ